MEARERKILLSKLVQEKENSTRDNKFINEICPLLDGRVSMESFEDVEKIGKLSGIHHQYFDLLI